MQTEGSQQGYRVVIMQKWDSSELEGIYTVDPDCDPRDLRWRYYPIVNGELSTLSTSVRFRKDENGQLVPDIGEVTAAEIQFRLISIQYKLERIIEVLDDAARVH